MFAARRTCVVSTNTVPSSGMADRGAVLGRDVALDGAFMVAAGGIGTVVARRTRRSSHPEVVRFIPQMFGAFQRRSGRQALISIHSPDLLRDEGIGLDEVLVLEPHQEGTSCTSPLVMWNSF